ncbi:MAG TPA: ATP-binding protein, partial [Bacteroidia bacterium]|nr:ATP-binding protein [Bacteroidia bacterium]
MLEVAVLTLIKPEVEYYINYHECDQQVVMEVIIMKGVDKPYYTKGADGKWWAYIRVKDQSLLASKVVLNVLKKSNSSLNNTIKFGTKEKALIDYLNANQKITVKQFCKLLNISRRRASAILTDLIQAEIIRVHYTEKPEYYTLS